MQNQCEVHLVGLLPYEAARQLQETLATERAARTRPDTLLFLEHPHTYTFGRSGQKKNLLISDETLAERGVDVHWIDRGGDITYHGPGQLIGYPILDLGRPLDTVGHIPQADYVGYIRSLEAVLINALARFGIVSGQLPGLTGVWMQPDVASRCLHCPPAARQFPSKIASIGVKVDGSGITRHGFALNVDPDMSYFDDIIACGVSNAPAVSMAQLLGASLDIDDVASAIVQAFGREFDREMIMVESLIADYT